MPLDHVFGDARLRDLNPELEQFAVDARRAPQRVLDTHSPDQCAQLGVNPQPPSKRARLPTPIVAKAGPMPAHERLGTDHGDDLQHRRKPSIQLDEDQAIAVAEADLSPSAVAQLADIGARRSLLQAGSSP
jgi:hypothetical protein